MKKNISLLAALISTCVVAQATEVDPLARAISKSDTKVVKAFASFCYAGDIKLSQEQKNAYLELSKAQVEARKLDVENGSCCLSNFNDLETSEKIGVAASVAGVTSGILALGYLAWGYWGKYIVEEKKEDEYHTLTADEDKNKGYDLESYRKDYKGVPVLLGTVIAGGLKSAVDLVKTFGKEKKKDKLKKAEKVQVLLEQLPVAA